MKLNIEFLLQHGDLLKRRIRKAVDAAFRKYLTLTDVTVSVVLCAAADVMEQKIIEKHKDLDRRRTIVFGCFGALSGIMGSTFYRHIGQHKRLMHHPLRMMLAYQFTFSPLNYALLYSFVGYAEGQSIDDCVKEWKRKFLRTYAMDCAFYMPFLYMVFRFVPWRFRMTTDNTVDFAWCTFLSFLKHNDVEDVFGGLEEHVSPETCIKK